MLFPLLQISFLLFPYSSFIFQLRKRRQDEFKLSLGHKVRHTPLSSARGPSTNTCHYCSFQAWETKEHKGKAHLYQVPEEHFPVLRAADHVRVALTQAAVQLVLLVLMANIPSSGGGEDQRGLSHPRSGERGKGQSQRLTRPAAPLCLYLEASE